METIKSHEVFWLEVFHIQLNKAQRFSFLSFFLFLFLLSWSICSVAPHMNGCDHLTLPQPDQTVHSVGIQAYPFFFNFIFTPIKNISEPQSDCPSMLCFLDK